jgi:putative transposase
LAAQCLDDFELTWGYKYPAIVKSWRSKWNRTIPFLTTQKKFTKLFIPQILFVSLNQTLRKAVKSRGHFPTKDAVMKVLYLAIKGVSKKWALRIKDWKSALTQFAIRFSARFPTVL